MAKVNKNKYNNGYSPMNYVSNVMSGVSAGSALGPAGMIIGGGLGLIRSISEKSQLEDANRNKQIQTAMNGIRSAGQNVLADYNMNLMGGNTGVPGFNKGKSSLGKNAFVSPDEIIRNGVTGDMTKVPGSYNSSNIDTVPASISPLDSVFSAASSQTIPFGKSTPADIAKKIKKVSDRAKTGGPIDRRTAGLMEKQLEKVDMYTALSNYAGENNKFNTGKPRPLFSMSYDKWLGKNMRDLQGLSQTEQDAKYSEYIKGISDSYGKIGAAAGMIGQLAPVISNISQQAEIEEPVYNSFINPIASYNIAPQLNSISEQSRIGRYNQSVMGGGAGMAYGSSLYGASVGARSNVYDAASKFHAEQLAGYADRFNAASLADSNELRRVRDVNARNRAATQSIRNTGLSQLSNFSQIREQMSNAKKRDEQQLGVYGLSNIDKFTPELMEKLNQILPGIFGSLK